MAKSSDFIGLNLYTGHMVLPAQEDSSTPSYYTDDDTTDYQVSDNEKSVKLIVNELFRYLYVSWYEWVSICMAEC